SPANLVITITGTNDVPVINLDPNNSSGASTGNYTTTYTENGPGVRIADIDLSITDPDKTHLTGATITLTNPQPGDFGTLVGSMPAGINLSYSGTTVTLSGTATVAAYQQAIQALAFINTSENPS